MWLFKKYLKIIDTGFEYFWQFPPLIKLLCVMTAFVIHVPLNYIGSPEIYTNTVFASPFFKELFLLNNILLLLHISAAVPAIIFGPILMFAPLRKQKPKLHRTLGTWYVIGCMLSAVTVFPLAISNRIGFEPQLGFGMMAVTWFTVTALAYTAARNKDYRAHRRWIMRSYAMTFAFVHVNLTYKLFLPYHLLSPVGVKVFQSMVSWQANLLLVELYLAATTVNGRFVGWRQWTRSLSTWSKYDRFYTNLKIF